MPGWFNNAWSYRRTVTVDNSGNSNALTQYTVSVALTSSNWNFSHAQSDGSDIRVTDSGGVNLIPYFIEAYDSGGQTGTIWVRVPYVAGSSTTTIYFYYGNASPASFTVPPTGNFARPAAAKGGGLAENMVYDSVTNKYYVVTSHTTNGNIHLWECATPNGTYTDDGAILDVGGVGTWDHQRVIAPQLFQAPDGTWVLYYAGAPDATTDGESIGYATASSITGTYTKYASNPVLSNTGTATFDRYRATEPYVFRDANGLWYLFYMGDSGSGSGSDIEKVGYCTSNSLDTGWQGAWTRYASNPVLGLGATGTIDAAIVADPWVYGPLNGHYYIGYSIVSLSTVYDAQIAYAVTDDFVNFYKAGALYGRGVDGEWDLASAIRGVPSLFSGTYYLPYAGGTNRADSNAYSWGIATMSATSTAQGFPPNCVFDYYDDFPGSSLDASLWGHPTTSGEGGSETVSGSVLAISSGAGTFRTLAGRREFGLGYIIEVYCQRPNADAGGTHAGEIGIADDKTRNPAARIYDYDNAKWYKGTLDNSGAGTNSLMAQNIDTSYHTQYVWWETTASMKYKNDANAWEQITTNLPTRSIPPWLFAFSGGTNTVLNIGSVKVRQYSEPEPSSSVGSENNRPVARNQFPIIMG